MEPGRKLTRTEFDAVIRRATELALRESDSGQLTEGELFRIAREVGVPDRHVQLALAQVRSGEVGGTSLDRVFGPEVVIASRLVHGTPRALAQRIDRFLVAGRLLQSVRRSPGLLQYRPAGDWISQLARITSATARRYYLASAKSVEVRLEEFESGRTLVEFRVYPGMRGEAVLGAALGGGFGGLGGGVAVGFALATVAPVALAVAAGAVLGGSVVGAITWATAAAHQKKVRDIHAEVEGVLDELETEEAPEPPPSGWREWMRRNLNPPRDAIGGAGADEFGRGDRQD